MTKIQLLNNDLTFMIASNGKTEKIDIKNGVFKNKRFLSVVITDKAVMLEGDENIVLRENVVAIYVNIKSVAEKIAEILQNDEVYLSKIGAIAEGRERQVLEKLI